ncbi:Ig-like domain repeat protein [Rathayibacter sp. Leaf248]|uniref:Ig-like domain repeat protein n=1 Tax=Rathayibacter sp. Leaf248 TaxID=2876555 RepID=UPI001E3719D6|nr:Ig-like domain repeat protein [Rathayibacter sp. Leaf248]
MTRHSGTTRRLPLSLAALGTAALVALGCLAGAPAATAAEPSTGWAGNTANSLGGTDYFVDATAGDDAAAGTSRATAWKSLTKASTMTYSAGDRILLKAGETWNGQQLLPKGSGAAGRPIVIDAYGDSATKPSIATDGRVASPFLPGTQTKNPETVGMTGAISLRNQQYWEIHDLSLSNDDDFATDITTGSIVRDGVSISINADKLTGDDSVMDYFRISGLDIHDIDGPSTWQRIHYGGINFQVFGSKQYTEYGTGGHHFEDVRIEDNTFTKVELHAVQFAFNWFGDAQGQTDETGKFHEGWEQAWVRDRDLYSRNVYIGHNYASDTGQGAIQLADTKDMVVEYNEVNGFLRRYNQVSAGLYLWAGADSVMRFNEVYDGPANEYDATPLDLEFTNFDVTYEYNYTHDNKGGWMSYMGNSSNSVARYNLSVNDNGVLVKNMLSTNYSPTYFTNNIFVYDGAALHQVHDEVFKSPVYFLNNVFYNTSTTTPTTWFRKPGALDNARFSNNAMFEASGTHSPQEPADAGKVTADPQFVSPVSSYSTRAGVENILTSAAKFQVSDTSPLIDAGRYNVHVGQKDFFGTDLYYGAGMDIGIQEKRIGAQVANPVDTDPIELEGIDTRTNLAIGSTATASSTHPHQNFSLNASKLVDGDATTRWAAADDATYPLTVDLDFGKTVVFSEVQLSEFLDSGTGPRIQDYDLQKWDAATSSWSTFASHTDGIGSSKTITGFGDITSSRLRLSITAKVAGEAYSPSMTEIRVFGPTSPIAADPQVTPAAGAFDKNASAAALPGNSVSYDVALDGDTLSTVRYVGPEGNVLGSLTQGTDYTATTTDGSTRIALSSSFLSGRIVGESGLRFEFASGATRDVDLTIVDTTDLEAALVRARAVPVAATPGYTALKTEIDEAQAVLDSANRTVTGTGNATVTPATVQTATSELTAATAAYTPPVQQAITSVTAPAITGTAKVGSTLRASAGTWSEAGVTLSYSWHRNGTAIPTATTSSYRLVKADAGASITVVVTASKTGLTSASATSSPVAVPATVAKTATTTKATATVRGSTITYTVRVTAKNGSAITGGTVTVRDWGTTTVTKAITSADGTVTITLPRSAKGLHLLTASYSGTLSAAGSKSATSAAYVR